MSTDPIGDRFSFARDLVLEAGAVAHRYFQGRDQLTIHSKGLQDMASEADLETELLIRRRIAEAFPEDAFLGEETGMSDFAPGQGVWVVDPIDGTQPFVSGMTSWCVSIAYLVGDTVEIGVVYAPARDEFFAARRGEPATLNGAPIKLHAGTALTDGMLGTGYSTRLPADRFLRLFERMIRQGGVFYRDGSGALMLCYVACGRLLGYAELKINSWDCLAAIAIIQAAGGTVSDFLANDGLRSGNHLIAAPPALYGPVAALFDD
jgi:myo-inositol-1(or 4)-monophosphatase